LQETLAIPAVRLTAIAAKQKPRGFQPERSQTMTARASKLTVGFNCVGPKDD